MSRSLIVLPDDSAKPIIGAIDRAAQSLRIKMFSLSDPVILSALINAHKRGVKTRVMLNPARRSGAVQNRGSRGVLREAGLDVLDTSPAFDVSHEKSMVVDDQMALIGSLNWDQENFERMRDYAVMTSEVREVREVIECFEADWSRKPFAPPKSSHLIWCPGGRSALAAFIESAKHSLYIQNERYQDALITEHIVRAKLRGVKVHVLTRPSHSLRADKLVEGVGDLRIMHDIGVGIHKLKHLRLHSKMMLADKSRAIIGSMNLSPGSLDTRRELAIDLKDHHVVTRLWSVVHQDWKNSHPLDLSDEGLRTDLAKHADPRVREFVSTRHATI
jgi:cardiolipin synthase A/B